MPLLVLTLSCQPDIKSEYQEFYDKNYSSVLFMLSGSAECLDAYSPEDERLYRNLQTVGHNGSSEAWTADLLVDDGSLYVICSGQNVIERYDARSLDYEGQIYLKNGFNPLLMAKVGSSGQAVVSGFATDEMVMVNLNDLSVTGSFKTVYEAVTLPGGSHNETQVTPTTKNAAGDNHSRAPTGIAVSGDTIYVSNVRYDPSIKLTDSDGNLAKHNGSDVRAAGNFREATLSIYTVDPSGQDISLQREINLDALYSELPGKGGYFPGNGLNPQSLFVLNGKLHIVCTGTNGGSARTFTSSEYIPEGYSVGDTVPGTDPDDGLILVMNISGANASNPVLEKAVDCGGSPVGFRSSVDSSRNTIYMAGVGGVQSYNYLSEQSVRGSSNPILAGSNPSMDYYSHVLFQDDILYISSYSDNRLNRIDVLSNGTYGSPRSLSCSGGPGALAFYTR